MNNIKELLPDIEILENEPMSRHTTFKVGGPAEYFCEVNNKADLHKVLSAAKKAHLPFFIFGGGSNLLVSDSGIKGLVIKMTEGDIEIFENQVRVFAGNNLRAMIGQAISSGLAGLEFAANIPGTVGGAIRGNAGAYGQGAGDFVYQVEALNVDGAEVSLELLSKGDCEFSYRDSVFKKRPELIIAEGVFKLLSSRGDIKERQEAVKKELADRLAKQPYECPSAGCTFKNAIFDDKFEELKAWEVHGKLPAARLIQEAGLMGSSIGGAKVSEKHANFIYNSQDATARDIMELMEMVKKEVKEKFGVELEEEVQKVGEFMDHVSRNT
ncbi:MAG TPA: UDP-N-acetylmuramate dehydrogenase [Candidatus Bipolaricaulota bacterium]|nr:UDP-N-acetylmuramate dehydrogenase [Candidatus Bipolaricaulota bacterium]